MSARRSKVYLALAAFTALIGMSVLAATRSTGGLVENAMSRPALSRALAQLPAREAGSFELITYNVAGLPEFLSRSHPSVNTPRMGPLLSNYDIAMVQEDFAYARQLRRGVSLPFKSNSRPGGLLGIGDGLNRFSRFPFLEVQHEPWNTCNGYVSGRNDCLAPKGFSSAIHYIGPDTMLEVYNLHMDAGITPGDHQARRAQVRQLLAALREYSGARAVIVAGDTNLWNTDKATLSLLLQEAGLRDACEIAGCPDRRRGRDKVLYRSGTSLELAPVAWREDDQFVDENNKSLSDHHPIVVKFRWKSLQPKLTTAAAAVPYL